MIKIDAGGRPAVPPYQEPLREPAAGAPIISCCHPQGFNLSQDNNNGRGIIPQEFMKIYRALCKAWEKRQLLSGGGGRKIGR